MAHLIDKDALVAEIEARYNECLKRAKIIDAEYWNGKADAYRDVLVVLDTLEVEEVDLDKPFEGIKVQTSMESGSLDEVIVTTKYKAQKGEEL